MKKYSNPLLMPLLGHQYSLKCFKVWRLELGTPVFVLLIFAS